MTFCIFSFVEMNEVKSMDMMEVWW